MLGHPALFLAQVRGDTERKALFAQKHVSAVSGVDRHDRVVFGEMHDVSLFGIDVALAVEALDEIAVFTQLFEAGGADPRHDFHVENDVNGVGDFNAYFGERRPDHAHGIGNDVHRSALHLAAGDLLDHLISFIGRHPFDDGMRHRVLFFPRADKRSVLYAGDVVFRGSVQIAIGQKLLVELEDFSGSHGLRAQSVSLRLAAVDPDDFVRLSKRRAVFNKLQNLFVVGHHIGYLLKS